MSTKTFLSYHDVQEQIKATWPYDPSTREQHKVWGVPRGGVNIALLLGEMGLATCVAKAEDATIICDDVVASGTTRKKYSAKYPDKVFYAPFIVDNTMTWLVFPWEDVDAVEGKDIVSRMLQYIGEDPQRPGLLDTPARVVRSWKELYGGYTMDAKEILGRVFDSDNNEMVVVKDVQFYSTCEHHLLPIIGKAHIAYIPKGKVVGLSKLARLVEVYARRLQIQEQLTAQVRDAMIKFIPEIQGAAVVIEAQHLCMCARGVNKQGSSMVTSALAGTFETSPACRAEFMSIIGK